MRYISYVTLVKLTIHKKMMYFITRLHGGDFCDPVKSIHRQWKLIAPWVRCGDCFTHLDQISTWQQPTIAWKTQGRKKVKLLLLQEWLGHMKRRKTQQRSIDDTRRGQRTGDRAATWQTRRRAQSLAESCPPAWWRLLRPRRACRARSCCCLSVLQLQVRVDSEKLVNDCRFKPAACRVPTCCASELVQRYAEERKRIK
jgi:hypothetical protein